jgi:hypothetical protein
LKFLPQRLLSLGLIKMGGGAPARPRSCSGGTTTTSGASRTARDDEASAPCVATSHSHPPASPTPLPQALGPVWASSPIGPTRGAGVVVRNAHHGHMVARGGGKIRRRRRHTTTAAPCCGLVATVVPRGCSLVATALAAARGDLDDHRLVGTVVSNLSTWAGARAGTVGVTLRMRNTRVSIDPSKSRTTGEMLLTSG